MTALAVACPWADAIRIAAFRSTDSTVVFGHGDQGGQS